MPTNLLLQSSLSLINSNIQLNDTMLKILDRQMLYLNLNSINYEKQSLGRFCSRIKIIFRKKNSFKNKKGEFVSSKKFFYFICFHSSSSSRSFKTFWTEKVNKLECLAVTSFLLVYYFLLRPGAYSYNVALPGDPLE